MTDITKLAEAVKEMRETQKEYFRTRSSIALTKSKKLEKDVDDMVRVAIRPPITSQSNMFGKALPVESTDLKHEIKFCLDRDMETNEHGVFLYTSSNGNHLMNMPFILSDYRDFLVNQGIAKDLQRSRS
jgi:hypothetical protein